MDTMHVVALSGGKDSTALALMLAEREPRKYTYVCTPTGDELPEMLQHWERLEKLLGSDIIRVSIVGGLKAIIRAERMLPNFRSRFCTRMLKIEPYIKWLESATDRGPVVSYVGLRFDEPGRAGGYYDDIDGASTRYPLREWKLGIFDVWKYLDDRQIVIPRRTDCARCYHQQLAEWWTLYKEYPDIYADAIADEEEIGHTYRTPGRDTWPVALKDLAAAFETRGAPERSIRIAEKRMENRAQCRVCSM